MGGIVQKTGANFFYKRKSTEIITGLKLKKVNRYVPPEID
jgi:hypothetical protein